jgi:hypothetical protein
MFAGDEATAATIRRAFIDEGEMSAMIKLRRRFRGVPNGRARVQPAIIRTHSPPEVDDRVIPFRGCRPPRAVRGKA